MNQQGKLMHRSLDTKADEVKIKIEDQKKHYKLGKGSICKGCVNMDTDCFLYMKSCEKDKDTNFSTVVTCAGFKKK